MESNTQILCRVIFKNKGEKVMNVNNNSTYSNAKRTLIICEKPSVAQQFAQMLRCM